VHACLCVQACESVCVCMHMGSCGTGRAASPRPEPGGPRAITAAVPTPQPSRLGAPLLTALPQQSPGLRSRSSPGGAVPGEAVSPSACWPGGGGTRPSQAEESRSLRSCVPCWLLNIARENHGRRRDKPGAVAAQPAQGGEHLLGAAACERDAPWSAAAAREQREVTSCLLMTNAIKNDVK